MQGHFLEELRLVDATSTYDPTWRRSSCSVVSLSKPIMFYRRGGEREPPRAISHAQKGSQRPRSGNCVGNRSRMAAVSHHARQDHPHCIKIHNLYRIMNMKRIS